MKETLNDSEVKVPVQENGESPISKKEEILNKGEERYEKTAQFISDAGTKISGWVKNGASRFGRFFKGAAIRAFAAPGAIAYGAQVTGEKIGEEASYVKDSVVAGATFVGEKVGEGVKSIGEDFEQAGKWVGGKATSAYEYSAENLKKAQNFAETKAEQVKVYTQDRIATVEAVGGLIKDATVEKLNIAKQGIEKNYNTVVEYGRNSVDSATLKCQEVKERFQKSKNAFFASVMERKLKNQEAKVEKTRAKLAQYRQVEEMSGDLALA